MQIKTSELRAALDFVGPFAASGNSPLLIASFVRLAMTDDGLVLTCTDFTATARSRPVPCTGDLDICLPVELFKAFVAKAGDTLDLSATERGAALKSGRVRAQIGAMPGADFPVLPEDSAKVTEVRGVDLSAMLASVVGAAAVRDVRPWANGVALQHADGKLVCVATDGGLAVVNEVEHDCEDFSLILHKDIVERLPKIESAEILERGVRFECAAGTVTANAMDAQFPDWRRIFSVKQKLAFRCDTKGLLDAIHSSAPFQANGKAGRVVRLDVGEALKVSGKTETQMMEAEIECAGDPVSAGFQTKYWMEILKQDLPAEIEVRFTDGKSQFQINNGNWRAVIMPFRV